MKLNKLFAIACVLFAFSAFGCDSDDDGGDDNGGSYSDTFKVPEYKEGDECTDDKLTPAFCDGNDYVRCYNGKLKKFDCLHIDGYKDGVCVWAPDLMHIETNILHGEDMASCREKSDLNDNKYESYKKCTEVGKITTVCVDDTETGSNLVYSKCMETTQGLFSIDYNYKNCSGKCADATKCAE